MDETRLELWQELREVGLGAEQHTPHAIKKWFCLGDGGGK